MLEPRRLATRAAAQRMASLLGERVGETVGYQTRDERHIGAGDTHRGRHRGRADPPTAARSRRSPAPGWSSSTRSTSATCRPTSASRSLLDARPTLRPDLRILAMSATPDISRLLTVLARRRRAHQRRPACTRSTCAGCRSAKGERDRGGHGRRGRPGAARGGRRRAGVPARASARSAGSSRLLASRHAAARRRRRASARRRAVARRSRTAPRRLAAGRRRVVLSHRHRRVVADGRRRAHRGRRRPRARAAVRPAHRDDPADHGQHQPRVGRSARRSGRAHRTGRRLPAVEQARARHPTGAPRGRDHAGRSRRAGARARRVGHAGRRSCGSSTHRRRARCDQGVELLAAPRRARRATAARPIAGRRMLVLPVHPRLARMVDGASADDELARLRASPRCSTSATCSAAAPTSCRPISRCGSAPCAANVHDRADRRDVQRVRDRAGGHRPSRRSRGSTSTTCASSAAARVLALAYPDRIAVRRSQPGQFQLRSGARAWTADDRSARRTSASSSPPTSTASGTTRASASERRSTPTS